jgi:hypothetical protein
MPALAFNHRRGRGFVYWRDGEVYWMAPVHHSGLVTWSKAAPADTAKIPSNVLAVLAVLGDAASAERCRGGQPLRSDLLPLPGRPLLLHFERKAALWRKGGHLVRAGWFGDLLLDWSSAAVADHDIDTVTEIGHGNRLLRQATPDLTTRLTIPAHADRPRTVIVGTRRISVRLHTAGAATPMVLDTGSALLDWNRSGVMTRAMSSAVLTRAMALDLAAEIHAYPGPARHRAGTRTVRHRADDLHDEWRTLWTASDGIRLAHDLRVDPFQLRLVTLDDDTPLTEQTAHRLAGALVAGVELLDTVRHTAVAAMRREDRHRVAARAEAGFVATIATAGNDID